MTGIYERRISLDDVDTHSNLTRSNLNADMLNISKEISIKMNKSKKQKQPPEVFFKKGVLRNFAKFTGKHL